jgi:hypothetical protein
MQAARCGGGEELRCGYYISTTKWTIRLSHPLHHLAIARNDSRYAFDHGCNFGRRASLDAGSRCTKIEALGSLSEIKFNPTCCSSERDVLVIKLLV